MQNLFFMQKTIELKLKGLRVEVAEVLIALLSDVGFEAFEESEQELSAYISESDFNKNLVQEILQPYVSDYELIEIEPRNWNAEWEQQYHPVVVDQVVGIRAGFHAPLVGVETEIVITPKMSFGTGHHATTWQMLKMMCSLSFSGKRVFDYGAGTGVLAIYAMKLGAAYVLAMDIDAWCVENATENAAANNCAEIEILMGEKPIADQSFDFVLANINRHILLENMNQMCTCINPGGYLLLSGFYAEENELLLDSAAACEMQLCRSSAKNEWSCLLLQKKIS